MKWKNYQQEVEDDLNVCLLILLPEVAPCFLKVEIWTFQIVIWPHIGQLLKLSSCFKCESLSH